MRGKQLSTIKQRNYFERRKKVGKKLKMMKINALKVEQLKNFLRERELSSLGTKSELVQRLCESVHGDEILVSDEMADSKYSESRVDENTKILQEQVNTLANMMQNLMAVVQTHISNTGNVNNTENDIPRDRGMNMQDRPFVNSCESVRDMASLLPEFNPTIDTSLNSEQFIKRIEMLKDAYKWSDNTLLFVVQQKLFGSAKLWIDSQEIFVSWQRFKLKFLQDFPCDDNVANVHIKLANLHRSANETPQEYFYKMMAIGNKAGLREEDIAHHIINGINDSDLRRIISKNYQRLNDLLRDINTYCEYNPVKNEQSYNRNKSVEYNSTKNLQVKTT